MFLRKLFKVPDKIKWLILELLVVFVGVYLAFLFQSYSENQKVNQEKYKVLISLKKELEQFRMDFPGNAEFQRDMIVEWDSLTKINQLPDYYNWRYLEPQYNFKVIEYAINTEGTDILDFELYEGLLNLYGDITKVQNAERVMTDFAGRHNRIPSGLIENQEIKLLKAQNRFSFSKFRTGARDRAGALTRVAKTATKLVRKINEELGPQKTQEVDSDLLRYYYDSGVDREYIIETFVKYFSSYSEDFIKEKFTLWDQE
jgi:hypothetical protein